MLPSPLILWLDFHLRGEGSSVSFAVSLITSQHLLIGCQSFFDTSKLFFFLSTCTPTSLYFIAPMMVAQEDNKTLLVTTYFNFLTLGDVYTAFCSP